MRSPTVRSFHEWGPLSPIFQYSVKPLQLLRSVLLVVGSYGGSYDSPLPSPSYGLFISPPPETIFSTRSKRTYRTPAIIERAAMVASKYFVHAERKRIVSEACEVECLALHRLHASSANEPRSRR